VRKYGKKIYFWSLLHRQKVWCTVSPYKGHEGTDGEWEVHCNSNPM